MARYYQSAKIRKRDFSTFYVEKNENETKNLYSFNSLFSLSVACHEIIVKYLSTIRLHCKPQTCKEL